VRGGGPKKVSKGRLQLNHSPSHEITKPTRNKTAIEKTINEKKNNKNGRKGNQEKG